MPAEWTWTDYTLNWSTLAYGQTDWLLHEQIPQGHSIQRFILSGGLALYNNEGWPLDFSNPMFAHEFVSLTVQFNRSAGDNQRLLRRGVGTSPVIEATAGTLRENATVGWFFPFEFFEVDIDVRWKANSDSTYLNVQAICSASKIDDDAMLPTETRGECWARVLTSTQ